MRREERPGADLPTDDVPSAEVLDELLRAFAADATDAATLERVDLTSPEVDALLAPTAPTPAPAESRPQVEVDEKPPSLLETEGSGSGDDAPIDPGTDAGTDRTAPEPPAPTPAPPPPTDDAATGDEVAVAAVASPTDEPADQRTDGVPATAGPEPPPAATPRTIVIDADDSRPDAVYLAAGDPLLAATAARRESPAGEQPPDGAPVFIDDAAVEAGETITVADATSATRIEPRLRERRIAVKRAAGRKRLRWVLLVAAVLVVVIAALAVLGSGLFAIDEVRVDGAVQTDPDRLQAVVDDLEGTPVLRADTDAAERELEAIPWVAAARVTTQFPDRATIELRERRPVAAYQGLDQRFRLIDVEGRVLEVLDGQPVDFLLVTTPDTPDLEPGQFTGPGIVAAANLIQALTPEMRAVATGVTVTGDGGDLRLLLTEGREVRFGPGRDLVVKLVRLQTKLVELAGTGFRFLDVSTDQVTTG